jgi:hypothetical protein
MKTLYKTLAFATCLIAAGCLISATLVEDIDFSASFNDGFVKECINLADYDIVVADLDGVNRVDLEGVIRNDLPGGAKDTINLYISTNDTYASKAAVEAATDVYPFILGYLTKPGPSTDTLTILEARKIIRIPGTDWDQVKAAVETGKFCMYFTSTGSGPQGAITEGTLWINFTGKP